MEEYRIFGPPGCGKTTALSRLIGEAAKTYGSDALLVASFTRAAAKELVGRNLPLERHQIGTLHAHCYHALGRPKIAESDALIAEWNQAHPWAVLDAVDLDGSLDDPYGDGGGFQKGDTQKIFEQYRTLRARRIPQDRWNNELRCFGEEWEAWKRQRGLVDFQDLIEHAIRDVAEPPFGAQVLFLDEVQDFSALELALVRAWAAHAERLYMAGDDDQCIYHFKGASPDAFLAPDIPPERKTILSQSYRVPKAVHQVAVDWIARVERREPKEYRPRPAEGQYRQIAAHLDQPDGIIEDVQPYLAEGKTVMILASCNYMLTRLREALLAEGIPFHNPYRPHRTQWNPLARRGEVTSVDRVLAYCQIHQEHLGEQATWWTYEALHKWVAILPAELFTRGAKTAIRKAAEDDALKAQPVKDEDLASWFVTEDAADGNLDWLLTHCLSSFKRRIDYPVRIAARYGVCSLLNAPRLILGTIHSVKGGEAEIVYLAPDLSNSGALQWRGGHEDYDPIVRMFYVGMTRARETLVFLSGVGSRAIPIP